LRAIAKTDGNNEKEIEYTRNASNYAKAALDIDYRVLPPDHLQTTLHKKNVDYFAHLNH